MQTTLFCLLAFVCLALPIRAQDLYRLPTDETSRWISFENPTGAPGQGGTENRGAKGRAYEVLQPGAKFVLADINGAGIIDRMWITVSQRSPAMLRALRIDMFWDGADQPAVSAPLGDFFGAGLGRLVPFENALFSSPEGRSFNFAIPMPFRTAARIELTNEGPHSSLVFYDINYRVVASHPDDMAYFHASWRRENPTRLTVDFEILPRVQGAGRFLGTNVGVITDSLYRESWWGEGEVKVYLDGDSELPTLVGTGTEDYIGTGWGQGAYVNRYQGAPVADPEARQWTFYRLHVPDPVYFHGDIRVTLQQIGGWMTPQVQELIAGGARLQPISIGIGDEFRKFLEMGTPPDVTAEDFPVGWINFYREDDVSATAYFFLDAPENGLPPLAPVAERTAGLE